MLLRILRGRYDSLLDAFGSDLSACGFGLNVSALSELCKASLPDAVKPSFANGAADVIAAAKLLAEK